jgi:hypothetical protein
MIRPSLVALVLGPLGACRVGWDPLQPPPTFELVGEHAPLACVACHPADAPPGPLPTACASCHADDRPPDHYDGDCGVCHTPFGWDDIVVDHDFFPLTNAHDLDCQACHAGGYAGTSPACESCHEDDRPTDHFGTEGCGDCHVPTTWADAHFDHDELFPLPHRGTDACDACHVDSGNYSVFSCISGGCHPAGETNGHHDEVGNYRYDSDACYDCHPRGQGDD